MTNRNYWLDLFTGKTWEEFLKNGAEVSGFRVRRRNIASKIKPGDYLICYITKISRFIGVLEVTSSSFVDSDNRIWEDDSFPIRFKVKLIRKLDAVDGVPLQLVTNDLTKFKKLASTNAWSGFLRGSPASIDPNDAQIILSIIEQAIEEPIHRPYDKNKYWHKIKPESKAYKKIEEKLPPYHGRKSKNGIITR